MDWLFPEIRCPSQTIEEIIKHLQSEINEFNNENDLIKKAIEVCDILHCSETLVRQFFLRNPSLLIDDIRQKVIEKNRQRGYYKKEEGC